VGIHVSQSASPQIRYNTIANNSVGIELNAFSSPTLYYNNIQDNEEYSIYLSEVSEDVDADDNWWGTTDYYAIIESIFDFEDDFNLGEVTVLPFLSEPVSAAPPIESAPEPTPTPTPTPSTSPTDAPTSSLQTLEIAILILLSIVAALLIVTIYLLLKRGR
jgi:parallel beta-helix repeat protein